MASPFGTTADFAVDAMSSNKYQWNSGIREPAVHRMVIGLSSTQTVTMGLLESTGIDSASPEWLQETLAAVNTSNAFPEASDYTYTDQNNPAKIQNVVQHFRKTAQVSGRAAKDKYFAAIGNIMARQVQVRGKELVRDMNYAIINGTISNTGESAATTTRGILSSISGSSNNSDQSGALLTSTLFKSLIKMVWTDNFEPTDVVLPSVVQDVVDTFTFNTTDYEEADKLKATSYKNVFVTGYGVVTTHVEKDHFWVNPTDNNAQMFCLDKSMWKLGWYRKTWSEDPPKDGDRFRKVIQGEFAVLDLASGYAGSSYSNVGTTA